MPTNFDISMNAEDSLENDKCPNKYRGKKRKRITKTITEENNNTGNSKKVMNKFPEDGYDRAEAHWQHLGAKSKTVGFFARHVSDKSQQRDILVAFVERMKRMKSADRFELDKAHDEYDKAENQRNTKAIRTMRPPSRAEEAMKPVPKPEGPPWKPYEFRPGMKCALCGESFKAHDVEHDVLPCRVCDDIFHRECLDKCGDLDKMDKHNMTLAHTNIGWSCPKCANISLLLSTDEIKSLTYKFEDIDINQDGKVSLPEYLHYHTRRRSLVDNRGFLKDNEKAHLTHVFKRMDQNSDNHLDWWEFVNNECKDYLSKMNKRELVDLLTNKELTSAKAMFDTLDIDGDGFIKEYEARRVYQNWYKRFDSSTKNTFGDSEVVEILASASAKCLMDADTQGKAEVTWEDFILDQALYIICTRPNMKIT